MSVVCAHCGRRTNEFCYDVPASYPRVVRGFLGLVVLCGMVGMYDLTVLLFDALPIVDKAHELGVDQFSAPGTFAALARDLVQLYNNTTRFFLAAMFLVMVTVSTRLLYLVIASLRGHPAVLQRIRRIALLQFAVEVVATASLVALGYKLEVIQIPFHFGYNIVLAPIAFGVSLAPAIKAHFSAYRVVPTPEPTSRA